jgi:hypothetical protein
LSIVRLLIHCGANVDEVNSKTKSTPLHLIVRCQNVDNARSVIGLLLGANAHIDCLDIKGYQPEDLARTLEIKELLHANQKLSLKCLCARLINMNNVCYTTSLSSNLIDFVRMHSRHDSNTEDQSVHHSATLYRSYEWSTLRESLCVHNLPQYRGNRIGRRRNGRSNRRRTPRGRTIRVVGDASQLRT